MKLGQQITCSGATILSVYWGLFHWKVKRPGREADHLPSSSAEVKELVELYLRSPNTLPWRGAQLKHRDISLFNSRRGLRLPIG